MMSEHQNLLKKALFVLSSRIKLSSKSQPGFQELLKYVVVHVFRVSCSVKPITPAAMQCFIFFKNTTNPQSDKLPICLIAQ